MPEVKKYEPGRFCWVELATNDTKAARAFYTGLFGWSVNETPMGDQGIYSTFQKGGKSVGAMYPQGAQEKGVPPHWNNYVAVASADKAAEKAKKLGANVVAGPFDVYDFGRMAFIADPQGAMFAVWEPKQHIGAQLYGEPGAFCWNELYTPDAEASRKFYSALFGWKMKVSPGYTEAHVGDTATGGIFEITKEMKGMPPNWMPYFAISDVDAASKKVKSLKGKVHKEPDDIPEVGRFSIVADPQGAGFALITLKPR